MNRKKYIQKTLLKNLKDNNNPDVEFVLVDFNSNDGLKNYIFNTIAFEKYIDSKQLKYYFCKDLKFWHASIAKNIAHKLAKGEILVNLDCDNFIGKNGGDFIIEIFKNNSNIILSQSKEIFGSGTAGRISITKSNFLNLGGYNESFFPVGYQDTDFIERAKKYNLNHINISKNNEAIINSKDETLLNTNCNIDYFTMENCNRLISKINLDNNELKANKYFKNNYILYPGGDVILPDGGGAEGADGMLNLALE